MLARMILHDVVWLAVHLVQATAKKEEESDEDDFETDEDESEDDESGESDESEEEENKVKESSPASIFFYLFSN